jgi:hypothetical protein
MAAAKSATMRDARLSSCRWRSVIHRNGRFGIRATAAPPSSSTARAIGVGPDQVQHLEPRAADLDLQAVVANLVPRDRRGRQREAPGHAGVIDDQPPKPDVGAA